MQYKATQNIGNKQYVYANQVNLKRTESFMEVGLGSNEGCSAKGKEKSEMIRKEAGIT
jgi:hypothetical protein